MQNLKIKVNSDNQKEAQYLLLELGYRLLNHIYFPDWICCLDGCLYKASDLYSNHFDALKEITIPQLKDMVILHRNSIDDATHVGRYSSKHYYVSSDKTIYGFVRQEWTIDYIDLEILKPIQKPQPFIPELNSTEYKPETNSDLISGVENTSFMSGKDALHALADGKRVEVLVGHKWECVDASHEWQWILKDKCSFRLKPRTIKIGDIEIFAPEAICPTNGINYYIPSFISDSLICVMTWSNNAVDKDYLNKGLVHLTKENAIAHAHALILTSGGSV